MPLFISLALGIMLMVCGQKKVAHWEESRGDITAFQRVRYADDSASPWGLMWEYRAGLSTSANVKQVMYLIEARSRP